MRAADEVIVTTTVAVDPATAFQVFTEEVDVWWRRGPRDRFGARGDGVMRFEPGPRGRLVEVDDRKEGEVYEVGRILSWEPGRRLVFEWRGRDFGVDERAEVEVLFEAEAGGTRVTLSHRGWDRLRPGHPARRGMEGDAFASMVGLHWADLLVGLRKAAGSDEGRRTAAR